MSKKNHRPIKFQHMKHSRDGLISIGLEVCSILVIIVELVMTIVARGQAGGMVGFLGIAALLLSVMGGVFAITSWQDEEANDTSKRIGSLLGIMVVIVNLMILGLGIAGR